METKDNQLENTRAQMRKGVLEFATLIIISRGRVYASEILASLKTADLIVVEGTLYPLLSRLRLAGLLNYTWEESKSGPPRKYYTLTSKGKELLKELNRTWQDLVESLAILNEQH